MRLSSSLSGKLNGESPPLALGFEYFGKPEVLPYEGGVRACLDVYEGGVRACLDAGNTVDLVDFGVEASAGSYPKWYCLLLDVSLGGVSWKLFAPWLSDVLAEGSWRSSQFHHHGNAPVRVSDKPL